MSSPPTKDLDVNYKLLVRQIKKRLTAIELSEKDSSMSERDKDENVAVMDDQTGPCSVSHSEEVTKSENLSASDDAKDDTTQVVQYSFPTPILMEDLTSRYQCYKMVAKKTYNFGIIGLGVSHCLSFIAYFCRYEARKRGLEVVSVGSDDGLVDNYYSHFVEKLEITSVSANPKLESVAFKTVDDLVEKRPKVVRDCVLLLIWPEFAMKPDATETELDVIRKLQPRAVLTVYEVEGMCGSEDFLACMRGDKNPGLDNYSMVEIGHQVVNFEADRKMQPGKRFLEFKMVKLTRSDCLEEDAAVTSAPPADEEGADDE